eukprot:TRINITY_DN1883_c0_g1_i2.p1 TRINITY_DN1883_c0_g1~~TRINITY_DN1883_c0_g1_i2.p1  ORF type:complete len:534 (+),score=131.26 TRINITY_DN1883_c0_g1_i2:178-1779(+)
MAPSVMRTTLAAAVVCLVPQIAAGGRTDKKGKKPTGTEFEKASEVSKEDVDSALMQELRGMRSGEAASGQDMLHQLRTDLKTRKHKRLGELEELIMPMYASLPKDSNGYLNHAEVRYVLHRLLAQQHGWFVKGLEPSGQDSTKDNAPTLESLKEWVPSHLQEFLESSVGRHNLGLHEVAVLAGTIEDIVRKEATARMEAIYNIHNLPMDGRIEQKMADDVLDTQLLVMHKKGQWPVKSDEEAWTRLNNFRHNYRAGWDKTDRFLRKLRKEVVPAYDSTSTLAFEDMSHIVEELGNRYAFFNNEYCDEMRGTLDEMQDERPGRVLLSDFYQKAIAAKKWAFTEKRDYLRSLGALDETDPDKPRVIMANYVNSRPQCLEASSFYAVCCLNECESLMSHLERRIAHPTATVARIVELISELSSRTVQAPRALSDTLINRLKQVASAHGDRVPLHGRLFSQWMHHAFPQECPYPHESGVASPLTPDEWLQASGQETHEMTHAELVDYVDKNSGNVKKTGDTEIPWSSVEEMIAATEL